MFRQNVTFNLVPTRFNFFWLFVNSTFFICSPILFTINLMTHIIQGQTKQSVWQWTLIMMRPFILFFLFSSFSCEDLKYSQQCHGWDCLHSYAFKEDNALKWELLDNRLEVEDYEVDCVQIWNFEFKKLAIAFSCPKSWFRRDVISIFARDCVSDLRYLVRECL